MRARNDNNCFRFVHFGYYRKGEYETDTTGQMAEIDKVSEIPFPPFSTDASKIVIKCMQENRLVKYPPKTESVHLQYHNALDWEDHMAAKGS